MHPEWLNFEWWWEQPVDLDAARDAALAADIVAADD